MRGGFYLPPWIVGIVLICITVPSKCAGTNDEGGKYGVSSADAVFETLLPVIYATGKPVRLYYRGACPSRSGDPVPFPIVTVKRPSKDKIGIVAVREIFENDKSVRVSESKGIIRIWIGDVTD